MPLPTSPRLALAALALALLPVPASAEAVTQDQVLQAHLLPGWRTEGGAQMAGLRLDLAPGWKTYWRSPGDAGIPPEFDWSASRNVASVRVHWPAPTVFHTNGMQTIGYLDEVVLPVEVVPRDPARPILLVARVDLGLCNDICMPASLHLQTEATAPGTPDPAIRAALAARPETPGEAGVSGVGCTVEPIADGLRLTAVIQLPALGGTETVAVETADPTVWVSESVSERSGGQLLAVADLVPASRGPFALDRSALRLTVIGNRGAVEISGCPAP